MTAKRLGLCLVIALVMTACAPAADADHNVEKLRVVATTTIVGDVVNAVGGDAIDLSTLLPAGADPHSFDPTPQDVARVAEADIVFVNGAGLEGFLKNLIENAGGAAQIVDLSENLPLLEFSGGRDHNGEQADERGADPHVWFDVTNVMAWVETIEQELRALDPANAGAYAANSAAYRTTLEELDVWIAEQVAQIPAANRKIVTDHAVFGYFAVRYGLEQVGAVIPGYSTLAEPSARELAELEDAIRDLGVKAIFVGKTVSPNLPQRVASDTGTQLVFLYTGSLSEAGGPASTYVEMMRFNVAAIVGALD